MLCRACKAALKRARQLTVQELPQPLPKRGSHLRRAGALEPGAAAAVGRSKAAGESPRAARALWLVPGGIALIGSLAYVLPRANPQTGAVTVAAARPVAGSTETRGATALSRIDGIHTPVTLVSSARNDTPVADSTRPTANGTARQWLPPLILTGPTRASSRLTLRAEAPQPAQEPSVPAAAAPSTVVQVQAAVASAPPAAPDRWQTMQDHLARCAREGGFAGVVCDQRTRLDSCEGFWGLVEQCPLPPENPGGQ